MLASRGDTTPMVSFDLVNIASNNQLVQGNPLGPLLFSLVVMELLDELGHSPGIKLQLWFLDDGSSIAKWSTILSLLKINPSVDPHFG